MKTVVNGKGSRRRPSVVGEEELNDRWNRAFRREKRNLVRMKPERKLK